MTDAASTDSSELTFRLIYRSHNRIPAHARKAELGAIFSVARSKNAKAGVTGALLVSDDWFVQILEGEEAVVRALYERIRRDSRHERISLVDEGTAQARTFGRWAMAKVAEDGQPDIPLITNVDRGGAVPAAARPTTPEQESVLEVMRESIREPSRST
ncbi:MAG TPA: BLUF domain-containing protein [Pseudonocardia sp.]|jgi:hypothetical protein|nr:BLUF domain-containing protein [Pseudonocardia sp.]